MLSSAASLEHAAADSPAAWGDSTVPPGWRHSRLDDISKRGSGHTPSQSQPQYWNGGVKWVSLADTPNLEKGYILETAKEISEEGLRNSSAVLHPAETVIISRDAGVGNAAILGAPMAVSQHFIAWECSSIAALDPWFLYYWLVHKKPFFERMAVGSTIKTIGLGLFERLSISYPDIEEQRRIAAILQTWDGAIDAAERLVATKNVRLDGLRSELMIGHHPGEYRWKRTEFGNATVELNQRNTNKTFGRDAVMGVTKANGLVPMREQTIGAELSRYQILPPRAFAYNPMRINVGSIAMSRFDRDVVVSPDYVLFACDTQTLIPEYLDQLRRTHFWGHYINAAGAGSVRIRIYYDALAEIAVPIPPIDEQRRILSVLEDAVADRAASERHLGAVQAQKRGLMQKLLTGEWRTRQAEDDA